MLKNQKPQQRQSIQYKGFFIIPEGCKYRIKGQQILYTTMEAATHFIDMIAESENKLKELTPTKELVPVCSTNKNVTFLIK